MIYRSNIVLVVLITLVAVSVHLCNNLVTAFSVLPTLHSTTTTIGTSLTIAVRTGSGTTCLYAATSSSSQIDTGFMWNAGLNFGKGQFKFYKSFQEWMSVFPEEDRLSYPETFTLPQGVYEVSLKKPLGIVFEEFDNGRGVYVKELVPGGNAEQLGKDTIQINDILIGITAVKVVGAKYERRLIPARNFDFDTMVGAIQSNEERFSCSDVVLMMERPSISKDLDDPSLISNFMSFFEPPFDNPWKQRQ